MRGNGNERTKDGVKRKKGHQGHSRPVGRAERQMRLHPTRLSLLLRGFGPRKIGGSGLGDFRCKCRNRNGGGCGRRGEACGFREEKGKKTGRKPLLPRFLVFGSRLACPDLNQFRCGETQLKGNYFQKQIKLLLLPRVTCTTVRRHSTSGNDMFSPLFFSSASPTQYPNGHL